MKLVNLNSMKLFLCYSILNLYCCYYNSIDQTIGLFKSHYFFGSAPINWDEYYPEGNAAKYFGKKLTNIIFEGEFRFDVFDDFYSYDKYLEQKKKIFEFS